MSSRSWPPRWASRRPRAIADQDVPDEEATRRFSRHSKDHRPDLPQVVLGMAVTAEGIPVRCLTFPCTPPTR